MHKFALLAALLTLGCGNAAGTADCEQGALGIEAGAVEGEHVTVAEVLPRSPADLAGIRRGDLLVSIGGKPVRYDCEVPQLVFSRTCEPVTVVVKRGGETIAKELTPADQTSLYTEACAAGELTACYRTAWLNSEVQEDACERGSAQACADYGHRLMEVGDEKAVAILERACERGSGAGCTTLAYLYATGTLVPKNDIRALDYYTRGCSYGSADGCYNVGVMYNFGRGTSASTSRAASAYEKACAAGVAMACTDAGWLYERGLGTMKDPVRAADMYRRGCEGTPCSPSNLRGCVNLGNAYRDGLGVEQNPTRAAEIYREACGRKIGEDEAEVQLRACVLLGAFEMNGLGVPKNTESGLARSMDGCTRGDALGCFNVAALHASREQFSRAAPFYDKSCEAGDAQACYELGVLYDEAKGVPFDPARSAALFRKACNAGFARACGR